MLKISGFVTNLNLNIGRRLPDQEIRFGDADKALAWKIYVELATRITLQPLPINAGTEKAALNSLHHFFTETRLLIRAGGPEAKEAARLGIFVLNHVLRPFTAKWHKIISEGDLSDANKASFRDELIVLQKSLGGYAKSLLELLDIQDGLEL